MIVKFTVPVFHHDEAEYRDTEVVLASDYEAIDAALNECIKDRDDAYARVDAMEARCKELEGALSDAIEIMDFDDSLSEKGLAKFNAILAGQPATPSAKPE